jgi:hypothetical protein
LAGAAAQDRRPKQQQQQQNAAVRAPSFSNGEAQYFRSERTPEPRGRGKVDREGGGHESPEKAKEEYKKFLEGQQAEKRRKEEAERRKEREREEREEREQGYDPYGRVGGGAPLRDDQGHIITNMKHAGMRGVSYVNPDDPEVDYTGVSGHLPESNESKSMHLCIRFQPRVYASPGNGIPSKQIHVSIHVSIHISIHIFIHTKLHNG